MENGLLGIQIGITTWPILSVNISIYWLIIIGILVIVWRALNGMRR